MHKIEKTWTTKAGLIAVVIVIPHEWSGGQHRSGYVGVNENHPLYGISYNEQADAIKEEQVRQTPLGKKSAILLLTATVGSDADGLIRRSPDILIDCHGGLTFSSGENREYPHPSYTNLWFFGFACNHCDDNEFDPRSLEYVEAECELVAEQLSKI